MMNSQHLNRRTIRFGGPDNASMRSAWGESTKSIRPPSPVRRKSTLGGDSLDKANADAALVAALDAGCKIDVTNRPSKTKSKVMKSALKTRSKTVPILKVTKAPDPNPEPRRNSTFQLSGIRSAWANNEIRGSLRSLLGPSPAQRQKTLEESELQDACASIAAMANESNSSIGRAFRDSSIRDSSLNSSINSIREFRDSSTRSQMGSSKRGNLRNTSRKDRSDKKASRW